MACQQCRRSDRQCPGPFHMAEDPAYEISEQQTTANLTALEQRQILQEGPQGEHAHRDSDIKPAMTEAGLSTSQGNEGPKETLLPYAINDSARRCAEVFLRCIQEPKKNPMTHNMLRDERARFKIWAGNLGVFAGGYASADYRLRDDPNIRDVILTLLRRLEHNLKPFSGGEATLEDAEELEDDETDHEYSSNSSLGIDDDSGSEREDQESTKSSSMKDAQLRITNETITHLYKITSIIKKLQWNKEEDRIKNWRKNENVELDEELQSLGSFLRWSLERTLPRLQHQPALKDRIIRSVLNGRQKFLYRANHRIKLQRGVENVFNPKPDSDISTEARPILQIVNIAEESWVPEPNSKGKAVTFANTEASAVNRKGFSTYAKSVVHSTISPSVKAGLDKIDVPAPPRPESGNVETVCPYCNLPLEEDIFRKGSIIHWKRHVLLDLEPYICLFEDCDTPHQQYKTKDEWINHMEWQHTKIWSCQAKGHEDQLFTSSEGLSHHINDEHSSEILAEQASFVVEKSAKPLPDVFVALASALDSGSSRLMAACPFCDEPEMRLETVGEGVIASFPEESYGNIRDHIAGHLELIALNALPENDDEDDMSNARLTMGPSHSTNGRAANPLALPSFDDAYENEDLSDDYTTEESHEYPSSEFATFADWKFVLDAPGIRPESFPLPEDDKILESFRHGSNALSTHHKRVLAWLDAPEHLTIHVHACSQRIENSNNWVFQSADFIAWKRAASSLLFLEGVPGCGKTVLSSTIVTHLELSTSRTRPVLFFYFDSQDINKRSLKGLIRSLIHQLYKHGNYVRKSLDSIFSFSHLGGGNNLSLQSLSRAFKYLIRKLDECWIVLDALDECIPGPSPPEQIVRWLEDTMQTKFTNLHILVTSHFPPGVRKSAYSIHKPIFRLSYQASREDMEAYARRQLSRCPLLTLAERSNIEDDIVDKLIGSANGSFLWVVCQLQKLDSLVDPTGIEPWLDNLPRALYETYERVMESVEDVPEAFKTPLIKTLQLSVFSKRPLRLVEMADILTEGSHHPQVIRTQELAKAIEDYIQTLVTVTKGTIVDGNELPSMVRLAHRSVQEYLLDSPISTHFDRATARGSIAKICLAYLSRLNQDMTTSEARKLFPAAEYCAEYWMDYAAAVGDSDPTLLEAAVDFFLNKPKSFAICYRLYNLDWSFIPPSPRPTESLAQPLYYACLGGLQYCIPLLLESGVDVNAEGGAFGNPLQAASVWGHGDIVRLLIEAGANVNAEGGLHGTALGAARFAGHDDIVADLLDAGAER